MKIFNFILFGIFFFVLVIFQREIVSPFIVDVANSDLFFEDNEVHESSGNMESISSAMSDIAFMHCNTSIRKAIDEETSINFQPKPLNAWDIGGGQYVINGEIETTSNNASTIFTKYVCRIHYSSGANEDEALKYENWSVYGISGLDNF